MILKGFVLPGLVQPLLSPKASVHYENLKIAFEKVKSEIEKLKPDVIIIYSTMWPSILGHQFQARPVCRFTLVDDEFHDLGSIPYEFKMDAELAKLCVQKAEARGLHARTVDYEGFPIDTGSVVALKLLGVEKSKIPAIILSSNIYADRAETVVLGKACQDALKEQNKKAVAIVISTLSNRLHQNFINPNDDKIHSLKDQEWNLKILEFFEKGRLEDLSQLSRQIHKEARVKKVNNFKPFWWLSSVMGASNKYQGQVYAYEPVYGTGCAVVGLTPALESSRDLEFDEDSPDIFGGERNVLSGGMSSQTPPDFVDPEDNSF